MSSEDVTDAIKVSEIDGDITDKLPDTVRVLTAENGVRVFLVGTAHFSRESQQDVIKTIQLVQPNVVMVELCPSRANILSLDEELLLKEASNINFQKISLAVKENGVIQGLLQILMLNLSAHITKQLGMAPGGEFRAAFREAKKQPRCRIHLGDRPIGVTLQRALGALSWYQKLQLAFCLIFYKGSISKEEVERCKQKDILEELLQEIMGEYPTLGQVFVEERDIFLANSLKMAAMLSLADYLNYDEGTFRESQPASVVGVVGIGHCPGIVAKWDQNLDTSHLLIVPPPSKTGKVLKWFFRLSFIGMLGWGCYRLGSFTCRFIIRD